MNIVVCKPEFPAKILFFAKKNNKSFTSLVF